MPCDVYPLRMRPAYQSYPWGGDRIARAFSRQTPPAPVAESWEVSDRPEGMSTIENGPLSGLGLREASARLGPALPGARAPSGRFPLLIKLIDARERLSAQVHPDESAAARGYGEAKTEMWILLETDPGAMVFAGFREGVRRSDIEAALHANRLEEMLRTVPVRPGDAVFLPGGRVHAIGAGCLILEIQQNSNTTYRLSDWGRVGPDGKPRETHVEQALAVIRWNDPGESLLQPPPRRPGAGGDAGLVHESPFFRVERLQTRGKQALASDGGSFQALFCVSGRARLRWPDGTLPVPAGTTMLLPAALESADWIPEAPDTRGFRIALPRGRPEG